MLVFGCRRRDEDFLYEDEILGHTRDGTLSHLLTAFSREGSEKHYVQDEIRAKATEFLTVLNMGASVYVCGAGDMAAEVRRAIVQVLMKHVGASEEKATRFVDTMRKQGRYMQDVW